MATKPMELMLEQVDYVNVEKNGQQKEFVALRPRIRGDVEANKGEKGNAGFYPAGKPGKSNETRDKQQTLSVDQFNKLMEKSGNELRVDKGKETTQLIGKDTPDNERPLMKAAMQGYKSEMIKDDKGSHLQRTPSSDPKDIENYRISLKSVEKSDFPEFSKEEHHKGISETNKARRELQQERQAEKQEQEVEKDADPEMAFGE